MQATRKKQNRAKTHLALCADARGEDRLLKPWVDLVRSAKRRAGVCSLVRRASFLDLSLLFFIFGCRFLLHIIIYKFLYFVVFCLVKCFYVLVFGGCKGIRKKPSMLSGEHQKIQQNRSCVVCCWMQQGEVSSKASCR